jgi:hypothetical protein
LISKNSNRFQAKNSANSILTILSKNLNFQQRNASDGRSLFTKPIKSKSVAQVVDNTNTIVELVELLGNYLKKIYTAVNPAITTNIQNDN